MDKESRTRETVIIAGFFTVAAALIGGLFLIANTLIEHNLSDHEPTATLMVNAAAEPVETIMPSSTPWIFSSLIIPSKASNGEAFTAPATGTYRFAIKEGIYCTGSTICRSIIRGYLGKSIIWDDWYEMKHPMNPDFELGCWEDKTAKDENCAVGMSVLITMKESEIITWIVVDDQKSFGDNTGKVVLTIEKQP